MGQQYSFNVVIGKNKPEIEEFKHEYVDLGLPSGTKWATHNLDMSNPNKETASVENYGSYCNGADYDIAHVQWGKEWSLSTKNMRSTCNQLKIVFKEGVLNKHVSMHLPFYLYASKFITSLFFLFLSLTSLTFSLF